MEFYKKHILKKSLGISLCIFCWITAAIQFIYSLNNNNTQMVNAFFETANVQQLNINQTTKEIKLPSVTNSQAEASDSIITCLKKYDKNINLVSSSNTGNYYDYYFYSPLLNKHYGINPLFQGSNIHIAITDTPVRIYIGIPYIDYDFWYYFENILSLWHILLFLLYPISLQSITCTRAVNHFLSPSAQQFP